MKKIITTLLIFFFPLISDSQQLFRFGVIGDYGETGDGELAVANLVKSWNPDFIITVGDNNYDVGSQSTIDLNIGQYYHEFIYPYYGSYGAGDTVNSFFPSLGNCDWGTPDAVPYRNYFTLPGNERYYEFIKGPVHFFVLDSDVSEYDGIDSSSVQAQWLKSGLASSYSKFNVVYFHHAPYCSGLIHGSEEIMRWPFKRWGASVVLSGHEHLYERVLRDGLTYFVNGLGGNIRTPFGFTISGSQVRYNSNFGAMLAEAYSDSVVFKFYNIANSLRDTYRLLPVSKTLSLNALIEGFYYPNTNSMIPDTIKVYLRNFNAPYNLIDSAKGLLNSNGTSSLTFTNAANATDYYLVVTHRNSIETWTAANVKFIINTLNYDFTNSSAKAFGGNLVFKGGKYCVYSGDADRDGFVDVTDYTLIDNDANLFLTGYVPTDLNGDGFVDVTDMGIVDNNVYNFVSVIRP